MAELHPSRYTVDHAFEQADREWLVNQIFASGAWKTCVNLDNNMNELAQSDTKVKTKRKTYKKYLEDQVKAGNNPFVAHEPEVPNPRAPMTTIFDSVDVGVGDVFVVESLLQFAVNTSTDRNVFVCRSADSDDARNIIGFALVTLFPGSALYIDLICGKPSARSAGPLMRAIEQYARHVDVDVSAVVLSTANYKLPEYYRTKHSFVPDDGKQLYHDIHHSSGKEWSPEDRVRGGTNTQTGMYKFIRRPKVTETYEKYDDKQRRKRLFARIQKSTTDNKTERRKRLAYLRRRSVKRAPKRAPKNKQAAKPKTHTPRNRRSGVRK